MIKNLTKLVLNNKCSISIITAISSKQTVSTTRLFCTRYTLEHEWARFEGGNKYSMGITDHASTQLGDIVFVEPPKVGENYGYGDEIGTIESVKAVAEMFAPIELKVTAVNELMDSDPETINSDPYGDGWICRFESSDKESFEKLMTEAQYKKYISEQGN